MENKKVREAKLLNGETALSVLSQKCLGKFDQC